MGRYYSGDINGKFVFAHQSSLDFEYYKNGVEIFFWFRCGCKYYNVREKYCKKCYSTYKNYREINQDPLTKDELELQKTACGLHYEFTSNDVENLQQKLVALENKLGGIEYVQTILSQINYTIDDEMFEHTYDYELFNTLLQHLTEETNKQNIVDNSFNDDGSFNIFQMFSLNNYLENSHKSLWYRYFIGLKIKKCLNINNECSFDAEY